MSGLRCIGCFSHLRRFHGSEFPDNSQTHTHTHEMIHLKLAWFVAMHEAQWRVGCDPDRHQCTTPICVYICIHTYIHGSYCLGVLPCLISRSPLSAIAERIREMGTLYAAYIPLSLSLSLSIYIYIYIYMCIIYIYICIRIHSSMCRRSAYSIVRRLMRALMIMKHVFSRLAWSWARTYERYISMVHRCTLNCNYKDRI